MHTIALTRHAAQRQQQRGISTDMLSLLLDFGKRVHDHRGCTTVFFDKRARQRVAVQLGKATAQMRFNAFAVLSTDSEKIITTGHLTRRVVEAA